MVAGEKAANFKLAKAYSFADALWQEKGFNTAENRADLVSKLDQAIAEFDTPVKI